MGNTASRGEAVGMQHCRLRSRGRNIQALSARASDCLIDGIRQARLHFERHSTRTKTVLHMKQKVAAGAFFISLLSACTSKDEAASEEVLFEFYKLVEQCRQTECQVEYPKNKACTGAWEIALGDSLPTGVSNEKYARFLQAKLVLLDGYNGWLAREAGKSLIEGQDLCSKKLLQVHAVKDHGDDS